MRRFETEVTNAFRAKLEGIIEDGRSSAKRTIETVMREVPQDLIVRSKAMQFTPTPSSILAALPPYNPLIPKPIRQIHPIDNELPAGIADTLAKSQATGFGKQKPTASPRIEYTIHNHPLSQMCYRVGVPWKYAQHLMGQGNWGNELLAHSLRQHFLNSEARRFLVRSYNGQIRGFLSDRFRRLDSRPLVEAFCEACQNIGAVPVMGRATDTKVELKAMIPIVFEPVDGEVVGFYVNWSNSDYGNGAHELSSGIIRLQCTNLAVMDTSIRNVHHGRRLDDSIKYSQRTYDLDNRAMASAIKDTVEQLLGEETTTALCESIRASHEEKLSPNQMVARLKKELNKGETQSVIDAFNSPDVEMLPPGNSLWRLSNAISWVANNTEDTERRMDLERVAGKALAWANAA